MLRKLISSALLLSDIMVVTLSGYIALYLRFEGKIAEHYLDG